MALNNFDALGDRARLYVAQSSGGGGGGSASIVPEWFPIIAKFLWS